MAEQDTIETFIEVMNKASDSTRAAIAQQLKDAKLYKGKVTGKFDIELVSALKVLGAELSQQRKFNDMYKLGPISVTDFLQQKASEGATGGDGTGGGTRVDTYVTSASQTAKLLDTVAKDLLGRSLTKAEKAKYTNLVNAQQKKAPTVTTTVNDGTGNSNVYTKGGVDEEQFLKEQIGSTAEAKMNTATDAYAVMMEELGGLR